MREPDADSTALGRILLVRFSDRSARFRVYSGWVDGWMDGCVCVCMCVCVCVYVCVCVSVCYPYTVPVRTWRMGGWMCVCVYVVDG